MREINQIKETVAGLTQLALNLASSTHGSSAEEQSSDLLRERLLLLSSI